MRLTGSEEVMGPWRDGAALRWSSRAVAGLIIALNGALIVLTLM
ncbi:NRAMP family metal ion (manganese) transporter [Actinomyces denticolens]|nr:NRAMP family metal ion (manganese) transporter [Actinomyces denticolens]